jgi:DNA-binding response OmpR family regulator
VRILLVEDDELLGDGIRTVLAQSCGEANWVTDGVAAEAALRKDSYDVVVLDLNLPGKSGFDILEQLRIEGNQIPVLVLTARERIPDRIRALDSGADDYVVKPCDLDELCARIRALYRRGQGMADPVLVHGDLTLNPAAHSVAREGKPIQLSGREFVVLKALLENVGRVMSRQRLEDILYGWDNEVGSNTVEVHIHHLRSKLGVNPIRTIRGVGYIIEKPTK